LIVVFSFISISNHCVSLQRQKTNQKIYPIVYLLQLHYYWRLFNACQLTHFSQWKALWDFGQNHSFRFGTSCSCPLKPLTYPVTVTIRKYPHKFINTPDQAITENPGPGC
jgi:hypothetical protein